MALPAAVLDNQQQRAALQAAGKLPSVQTPSSCPPLYPGPFYRRRRAAGGLPAAARGAARRRAEPAAAGRGAEPAQHIRALRRRAARAPRAAAGAFVFHMGVCLPHNAFLIFATGPCGELEFSVPAVPTPAPAEPPVPAADARRRERGAAAAPLQIPARLHSGDALQPGGLPGGAHALSYGPAQPRRPRPADAGGGWLEGSYLWGRRFKVHGLGRQLAAQ